MIVAHIGALPVEEMLPAVAPAVAAMAYMTVGLAAWLRRR